MIRSMTCFSRGSRSFAGRSWNFELKSVNQKYFELTLRIPQVLMAYENEIRALVHLSIERGKVTLNISDVEDSTGEAKQVLNQPQIDYYLSVSDKLRKEHGLKGELQVSDLLRLPGTIHDASSEAKKVEWKELEKALQSLLKEALAHREDEGKRLASDILERVASIQKLMVKIEVSAKKNVRHSFENLKKRMVEILRESGAAADPERIYREAAILAERSDITEELVRMRSHVALFSGKMKLASAVGRSLDFICQEMNREANTMGSKAQLFEITKEVIQLKSEIEKIREQVQNIE
ncbi:MAG TPA: YicC family protein [Candidatus Omnitrophica bacterium]|nr:YicC family protein [Candidatus Omnitrophota bacterium]